MENMLKYIIAAIVLALLATACYIRIDKGVLEEQMKGRLIARESVLESTVSLGAFTSLDLNGSYDVKYIYSEADPFAVIKAKESILPYIKPAISESGALSFDFDSSEYSVVSLGEVEIEVHGPALDSATLKGSGSLELGDFPCGTFLLDLVGSGDVEASLSSCKELIINLKGSGDIDIDSIDAESVNVILKGSGDVKLSGKCGLASYQLNGSGDINAKALEAGKVSSAKIGSGDIRY